MARKNLYFVLVDDMIRSTSFTRRGAEKKARKILTERKKKGGLADVVLLKDMFIRMNGVRRVK